MSLSDPAPRKPLHTRRIECMGYDREDGLWDIEGRLTDTKSYAVDNEWRGRLEPGDPIHDMRVRLTLDDEFTVKAVEVSMQGTPFEICSGIEPDFQRLEGERIVAGWSRKLSSLFSGTRGCTHVVELLGRMGTVAYQTIPAGKSRRASGGKGGLDINKIPKTGGRPYVINTCHAWAADGPVVQKLLPEYYEGPDNPAQIKK